MEDSSNGPLILDLPPPGIEIPPELPFIGPAPEGWAPPVTAATATPKLPPPPKSTPITRDNTVCLRHCAHYMETHDSTEGEYQYVGREMVGISRTCLRLNVAVEAPVYTCNQYDPISPTVLARRRKLADLYDEEDAPAKQEIKLKPKRRAPIVAPNVRFVRAEEAAPPRRKPGRPKGSKNRKMKANPPPGGCRGR